MTKETEFNAALNRVSDSSRGVMAERIAALELAVEGKEPKSAVLRIGASMPRSDHAVLMGLKRRVGAIESPRRFLF